MLGILISIIFLVALTSSVVLCPMTVRLLVRP
jgi:hypothetical protein